jgi:hypothetical protein
VIAIVDALTGALVRTVTAGSLRTVRSVHFDARGSRLMVARELGAGKSQIALIDPTSGQDVATVEYPHVPPNMDWGGCAVDVVSARRAVGVVACSWFADPPGPIFNHIFETRRLELDSLTWGPVFGLRSAATGMSLNPEATRLIATSRSLTGGAAVQIVDAVTGASIASVPVDGSGLGVGYAPLAPVGLLATVNGPSVRIEWSLPAHSPPATEYAVEVGSGPGLSDVAIVAANASAIGSDAVPRGRYYVRARAVNHSGAGEASAEIVVDVP